MLSTEITFVMRTSTHLYPPYYCLLPPPHLLLYRYLHCFSASHPTPLFHCIFVRSFVRPSFRPFVCFFPKSAIQAWIEIVTVYRSMTGRIYMPAQACSLKIACFLFSLAFLLSSLFPFFLSFSILLLNLPLFPHIPSHIPPSLSLPPFSSSSSSSLSFLLPTNFIFKILRCPRLWQKNPHLKDLREQKLENLKLKIHFEDPMSGNRRGEEEIEKTGKSKEQEVKEENKKRRELNERKRRRCFCC